MCGGWLRPLWEEAAPQGASPRSHRDEAVVAWAGRCPLPGQYFNDYTIITSSNNSLNVYAVHSVVFLSRRVTLTHFGTVLWGRVWERMPGTELRGGGRTSEQREGTAGSDTEGTSFLSGRVSENTEKSALKLERFLDTFTIRKGTFMTTFTLRRVETSDMWTQMIQWIEPQATKSPFSQNQIFWSRLLYWDKRSYRQHC